VATVNSGGRVTFVAQGAAHVAAVFPITTYNYNPYPECTESSGTSKPTVTVNVGVVPTSASSTVSVKTTYNGNNVISTCPDGTNYGVGWGYSRHITYTLLDQNGIAISSGNFSATENNTLVSQNPSGQTFTATSTANLTSLEQWCDFLSYWTTVSPGPTSGTYLNLKRVIDIKDNNTGHVYPAIRTECVDFNYNDVTVKNVGSGGTCP
jgi:hypothetical protein